MRRSAWNCLRSSAVVLVVLMLFVARPTSSQVQGTSVPILLVVNDSYAANPFGRYLGEILRAEGLNAYEVIGLSSLSGADLTGHDLTILVETTLSGAQAAMLNSYVGSGGRLLAMRPDPQIAALFGLGTAAGALTDGYLRIDPDANLNGLLPGEGLTDETLQIHGTADCYSPAGGAAVLAQLYSDATTATSYPAVVGAGSGRAVAFTYDLVRNVAYTRQGNPANGNLDVDADGILRTVDLFQTTGGGAPWVNRDKIPIPQADEQQRLFARLVRQMVGDVMPLPQMWYFPGTAKTMLIATADSHGTPTASYQNEIASLNARGAKATFYLSIASEPYESEDGPDNDLLDWMVQGHTFGLHPYWYHPDTYPPYNVTNLAEGYAAWDSWFADQYPSTPRSATVRNHELAWVGWTDAAELAESYAIELDTTFYHWGPWLQKGDWSWPHGYFTGSGRPMKFVRADGHIIELYQQLTQLVDEQMILEGVDTAEALAISQDLIDASLAGDYAALTAQFHVDYYSGDMQAWAEGTMDYANSHGVPVWNADQWLEFTQIRHDADYVDLTWSSTTNLLTFDLSATTEPSVTLSTLVPLSYKSNPLEWVKVDGLAVSYSTQTISGVDVALIAVPAGDHSLEVKYQGGLLPSLSINDVTVTEGNSGTTQAVFTVTASAVSTQTMSVNYVTADGTAVAPGDYTSASGTVTFAPGVTTQPVTVTVRGDTADEADEAFLVNLAGATNAIIGDGQGVGTITDDDPSPSLSINDVSVTEGDAGSVNALFTVTLSTASSRVVTVDYVSANGTATAGTDYVGVVTQTLTFTPGQTTCTLTVTVSSDTLDEADETFFINLGNPINATVSDAQGVGTIVDNDPLPVLSINDVSVMEGNAGSVTAVFTVSLSIASGRVVTVEYATANGTATAGTDYAGVLTQTMVFATGQTSQTVSIVVLGDTLSEADETFFMNLANPVNATIGDGQGMGTIIDDESLPSLSINDASVTEGDAGSVSAVFTVTLSAASGKTVTVDYATANGTAMAGTDYTAVSTQTLTFAPGQTTKTVSVAVLGDVLDEADETFLVNLASPTNAAIVDGQGVGTIADNDPLPVLSVDDVTVTEGDAGSVNAVFTVSLSSASGRAVTVEYTTADGTAAAGADYTGVSAQMLTFTPGQTSQTFSVAVRGDVLSELNETFVVNLGNALNALVGDGQGVGTILDNDPLPSLSINDVALPEGDAGSANMVFTVSLSAPSGRTVTVDYATADGTAIAGEDYTAVSTQTLTFTPGQTTRTFSVVVHSDLFEEPDETYLVNLSNAVSAIIGDAEGVGTILDDDVLDNRIYLPLIEL